jgi:BASS family bile acid:Na+ symporter
MLLIATILHNLLGYLLGYWGARLMGMNQRDARTVAIEVGTQNGAMATGLARGMNKLETVGLAAVIFAPLMNVTGSILANHWRRSVKQ